MFYVQVIDIIRESQCINLTSSNHNALI